MLNALTQCASGAQSISVSRLLRPPARASIRSAASPGGPFTAAATRAASSIPRTPDVPRPVMPAVAIRPLRFLVLAPAIPLRMPPESAAPIPVAPIPPAPMPLAAKAPVPFAAPAPGTRPPKTPLPNASSL